jgi:hypothetical protein
MPHKPYFRFLRSSHGRAGGGGGSAVGRVHRMAQASGSAGGCGDDGMSDEAANWSGARGTVTVFSRYSTCVARVANIPAKQQVDACDTVWSMPGPEYSQRILKGWCQGFV